MNNAIRIICFLLGFACALLLLRSCEKPKPVDPQGEYIAHWIDTTIQEIYADTLLPVQPFSGAHEERFHNGAWGNSNNDASISQSNWIRDFIVNYKDSLLDMDGTVYLDDDTCKVTGFRLKYFLKQPTIREYLVPKPPAVAPVVSSTFLVLQPSSDGTKNGLGIGATQIKNRVMYGLVWDPWMKQVRGTLGIKLN